ncbi:PEP-CTERM sorting domain-containing protein [uncultured Nostoc sp.]|uniref:PEP-CTERM sorting domain-containing protein n=1 Tax=uncultured Nostoc sp. TaxID=340711 RepID=UPI0035CB667C
MIGFKSKFLNATLAATFAIPLATAGMFTSAGSAQAVTLSGSIGLTGTSVIPSSVGNPDATTIGFADVNVTNNTSGNFLAFSPTLSGTDITIKTLSLTKTFEPTSTLAIYSTNSYTPFIDFGSRTLDGTTAFLTFDLDNSVLTRTTFSDGGIGYGVNQITGKFNFNGQTIATGLISGSLSGTSSGYELNLTAKAVSVPEPTTMLGLSLVGAGIVVSMSRRRKTFVQ